jgi:poly(beta-D-mannuronate) lyase
MRVPLGIALAMSALLGAPGPLRAGETSFSCPAAPEPVVTLTFGSRYTDNSKTRSDIDEVSNAEVDKALQPVEKFINALSKMANAALLDKDAAKATCVLDWLDTWAEAGALAKLETMNVQLAIPARFSGLAMTLLQAETATELDPEKRTRVVAWLDQAAKATISFFDNDAPKNASRNNLRAWAGLAVAATARLNGRPGLMDWAKSTLELVACQAADDGSLPLEMGRAERALNYQLHATAPLVVLADLLQATGYDGYAACGGKLSKIAAFSLKAVQDPVIVEAITGQVQTFSTGEQPLQPYMLAWVETYLRHAPDPTIDTYVEQYRPLSHAKLGGNLTQLGDWVELLVIPTP